MPRFALSELRVLLKKRKYSKVTPFSTGDDSDNDTGRIIDDYFQLHNYDSEEDSDYVVSCFYVLLVAIRHAGRVLKNTKKILNT